MRALKEEVVLIPSDVRVSVQEYQYVIERALVVLNELELKAIRLRFWGPYSIAQVADRLCLKWDEADRLIDQAVNKIRVAIRKHQTLEKSPTKLKGIK